MKFRQIGLLLFTLSSLLLAPWQAAQAQNEVVEAPNATPSTTLPEDSGDRVTLHSLREGILEQMRLLPLFS
jgi:hypothetical protein